MPLRYAAKNEYRPALHGQYLLTCCIWFELKQIRVTG